MHPLNAVMLGLVVAWAVKRRNGVDPLGPWRYVAALAGSLFAYVEIVFGLMGPGAAAQAYHGITWSVVLLPFYGFMLSGIVGGISGRGWGMVFAPVLGGLIGTWTLGILTEEGIFPLAMLASWRLGLGLLNSFDFVLLGLCVLGVIMARVFPMFDRDMSRITLGCIVMYVAMTVFWGWQAHKFGENYATVLGLKDVEVHALPQPLSPLNWRVIVEEPSGRLHDAMINLQRSKEIKVKENMSRAARIDALYKPKSHAVWRVYRRYGGPHVKEDVQRRVRGAWHAWQEGVYGWYGRYAVFDGEYGLPAAVGGMNLGCVGFVDLRMEGSARQNRGRYLICPARGGGARVFQPVDGEKGWSAVRELVPLVSGENR